MRPALSWSWSMASPELLMELPARSSSPAPGACVALHQRQPKTVVPPELGRERREAGRHRGALAREVVPQRGDRRVPRRAFSAVSRRVISRRTPKASALSGSSAARARARKSRARKLTGPLAPCRPASAGRTAASHSTARPARPAEQGVRTDVDERHHGRAWWPGGGFPAGYERLPREAEHVATVGLQPKGDSKLSAAIPRAVTFLRRGPRPLSEVARDGVFGRVRDRVGRRSARPGHGLSRAGRPRVPPEWARGGPGVRAHGVAREPGLEARRVGRNRGADAGAPGRQQEHVGPVPGQRHRGDARAPAGVVEKGRIGRLDQVRALVDGVAEIAGGRWCEGERWCPRPRDGERAVGEEARHLERGRLQPSHQAPLVQWDERGHAGPA